MSSEDIDYERLASEVLRALRGARSQVAFARRLGFRSNVPYTWESGSRFPRASTFLQVAGRAGIDPEEALLRFHRPIEESADPPVQTLVRVALGGEPQVEIARRAGVSRQALGRWLSGSAEPRLPDLLRLLDVGTRRLPDFVACFVDPEELPSLRVRWRQLAATRALVRSTPWAPAVALCLELEAYRAQPHERGFVARRLGIDVALEDACLGLLEEAGQIRFEGERYVVIPHPPVEATRTRSRSAELKQFWGSVAQDRLGAGLVSWNLFAVSRADLAAIAELQRETWRRMRGRVEASEPSEVVALAFWTLVPLSDPPEGV